MGKGIFLAVKIILLQICGHSQLVGASSNRSLLKHTPKMNAVDEDNWLWLR